MLHKQWRYFHTQSIQETPGWSNFVDLLISTTDTHTHTGCIFATLYTMNSMPPITSELRTPALTSQMMRNMYNITGQCVGRYMCVHTVKRKLRNTSNMCWCAYSACHKQMHKPPFFNRVFKPTAVDFISWGFTSYCRAQNSLAVPMTPKHMDLQTQGQNETLKLQSSEHEANDLSPLPQETPFLFVS